MVHAYGVNLANAPVQERRHCFFRAESFNETDNTIEILWSTGARVIRRPWFDEPFDEELSLEPGHVRLDRINNSAPFLKVHNGWQLESVLGLIVPGTARVASGEGTARVRLSKEEVDAPIVNKIRDGIIRNVSVGYQVYAWEVTEAEATGGRQLRRAIDWEPFEVSAVPMGADVDAHIRSLWESSNKERRTMDPKNKPNNADPTPEPAKAPAQVDLDAVRAQAIKDENERQAGIRLTARKLPGIKDEDFAPMLKDVGVTVDAARAKLIDIAAERSNIGVDSRFEPGDLDEGKTRGDGMRDAIMHRSNPDVFELNESAREYAGLTLMELARISLEAMGVKTRGMGRRKLATEALRRRSGGLHSTSDFPLLLADAQGKSLQRGYDLTPRTFVQWAVRGSASDYKDIKKLTFGETPELEEIQENGEFRRGTIAESQEKYAIRDYGKVFGVSHRTLINDDLGAISGLPMQFGASGARKEADVVYALVTGNVVLSDSKATFHVDHKNLVVSGAPPDVDQISAMRELMSTQTGLSGADIDVVEKFILTPHALRTTTEQFLGSTFAPTTQATSTPDSMRQLIPVFERRLDRADKVPYYMIADPLSVPYIEYAFLDGEQGVSIESRTGFDVLGVETRAWLAFGAGVVDFRGAVKNNGV